MRQWPGRWWLRNVTGQPAAAEFIADKAVEIALGFAQADHRQVDTPMMIATRIPKAIVSLRVREVVEVHQEVRFAGRKGAVPRACRASGRAMVAHLGCLKSVTSDCAPPVRYFGTARGIAWSKSLKHWEMLAAGLQRR